MSADGPWVRFFPSDWLAGTRGMSASETGVYVTLVALMYERTAPLDRDDARLARLCGLPTNVFRTILDTLIVQGKVTLEGEKLWGRRVALEVEIRKGRSAKASVAAKAKHQQNQRPVSANASSEHSVSTAPDLLRARGPDIRYQISEDTSLRSVAPLAPKTKGTRLSDAWVLPKAYGDWALEKGLPRDRIMIEADKMKNWSINAGKTGVKVDWFAAWKNWVQKAIDDLPGSRSMPPRNESVIDRRTRELKERIANEHGIGRERNAGAEPDGDLLRLADHRRGD